MDTVQVKHIIMIDAHKLAYVVENRIKNTIIIDSRSFLEYNTSHVLYSVNVNCSKIVKRRLQQDMISIKELMINACHCDFDNSYDVIVYDQGSIDYSSLPDDSFISVLLSKLNAVFKTVFLVNGGFLAFQSHYPKLCENVKASARGTSALTSLSQPCLSNTSQGPTRILPFLFLGSQQDAFNKQSLRDYNITYELNVSTSCPKSDFVHDTHFLRIPVDDNYTAKLLPFFPLAFQFLDSVREAGGCVLVHCLAGISRSAAVTISYVMRHLKMSSDEAYRYVKFKRATISPNFHFLGQLLEYEAQLKRECASPSQMQIAAHCSSCSTQVIGGNYCSQYKCACNVSGYI